MARKNDKAESGLGELKNSARQVVTPSGDNAGTEQKQPTDKNAALISALTGRVSDIIDIINDNIYESMQNIETFTDSIYNAITDISDESHILGATLPKDYFETIKANVYETGRAFDTTAKTSYASAVISELNYIQSGVYAIAAALWGWSNVKTGTEISSGIKQAKDAVISVTAMGADKEMAAFNDMMLSESGMHTELIKDIISIIKDNKTEKITSETKRPDTVNNANIENKSLKDAARIVNQLASVVNGLAGIKLEIDTPDNKSLNELFSLKSIIGKIQFGKTAEPDYSKYINTISTAVKIAAETNKLINEAKIGSNIKDANKKMADIASIVSSVNKLTELFDSFSESPRFATSKHYADFAKSAIESSNEIITALLSINTNGAKTAHQNIKYINDITLGLRKVLVTSSPLTLIAPFGALGFAVASLAFKAISKQIITICGLFNDKITEEAVNDINNAAVITSKLANICASGALLAVLAPPAILGFTALIPVVIALSGALAVMRVISGDAKANYESLGAIASLTLKMAGIMMIGAAMGALAAIALPAILIFTATLSLFIFSIVATLDMATKFGGGLERLKDTANSLVEIVAVSALVMLVGGGIMAAFPQVIVASLAFALSLSVFLLTVVSAINLATKFNGGIERLQKNAVALTRVIAVSALIMLTGGAVMLAYPNLILASFAFTAALALFLVAITGAISIGANAMRNNEKSLVYIMAFEVVTAAVLLLPAYIMMQNPDMWPHVLGFVLLTAALTLGLSFVAKYIGKHEADFIKAAPVMFAMSAMMVGMGLMMIELAYAAKISNEGGGWQNLAATATTGIAVVAAIAGGAFALGKFGDKTKMLIGISVIAAAELLALGMAGVLGVIANITNEITDFGKLWKTIGSGFGIIGLMVGSAVALGAGASTGVGGLLFGAGAAVIASCSALAVTMAHALRAIDEASKLNIDEKAISSVISTMRNVTKELLNSGGYLDSIKIYFVSRAYSMLGESISKIAKGVADASDMHYTRYENGKKVGEFNLTGDDFTRAGENTKAVVSTLGSAIIDIYNENPEIFNTGTWLGDFIGTKTKFEKVCGSVSMLGRVISKIASGVSDMASLHFTKYENGKKVGEFNIGENEFNAAAYNVKRIISTLGGAIMDAYAENPEIFSAQGSGGNLITNTLGGIAGFFGADTKFAKVAKSMMALGNLMSKLSVGVKDMVNITVTEYGKDGKETKRAITEGDFTAAMTNTSRIVSFIGSAVIKAYNDNPDLFASGSGLGDALGFNPKFKSIIDTISSLGNLMSNIAGGIQAMANNNMPVYGKNGEIVRRDPIDPSWYGKAAGNITHIITCMGESIMSVYNAHPDWFRGKWWALGDSSDNNAFTDVMKSMGAMADIVGKYAKIVQDYANGKIDIYGANGKVIGSVPITKTTYTDAASAVSSVISVLASNIWAAYNANKQLFDKKTFAPLMDNLGDMAKLLGKYSDVVKNYANMTYDVYDASGKAIGKKHIGEQEFTTAADNIKSVMTTLVGAVYDAAFSNKDGKDFKKLFEDTAGKGKGDTWFTRIVRSFNAVAPLISSMSTAVQHYATLQVPEYGENGVATGRMVRMKPNDFTNAGTAVKNIVTTLIESIGSVWDNGKYRELFINASSWGGGSKDNTNRFYVIATALMAAAKMTNDAALATKQVLSIPGFENTDNIKKKLDARIPVMVTALIQAVADAYKKGETGGSNMFDMALTNNSPFRKVSSAMQSAYDVVSRAAKVYASIAKMDMAQLEKVTGTGDPTNNKVYQMIDGLARPIVSIYTATVATGPDGKSLGYSELFNSTGDNSYFMRITNGVKAVATIMGAVERAYSSINEAKYDVTAIKTKINSAIRGLIDPITDVYKDPKSKQAFDDATPVANFLGKALSAANPVVAIIGMFTGKKEQPDTPAMRVIQAVSAAAGIMRTVATAYAYVNSIKWEEEKTKKKMTGVIKGLADVFAGSDADFYGARGKARELNAFVKFMSQAMLGDAERKGLFDAYKELQDMHIGSQAVANNIGRIMKRLVEGAINAVSVPADIDTMSINASFYGIKNALETVLSIYKLPGDMLSDTVTMSGAENLDMFIASITNTLRSMPQQLGMIMSDSGSIMSNSELMDRFVGAAWNMKRGVSNLAGAINMIPVNKDIGYFIPYIKQMNSELGNVPNLDNFVQETETIVRFNSSVNSLQVYNVMALTSLVREFNNFSSKFGNLDKFTQVLATKMAQCLTYLADQIRDSAKTIGKAEEIQKKRQEQIQKTIAEFKKLADMGLEVTVKAAEADSTTGSFSGFSGGDDTTSAQQHTTAQNNQQPAISQQYGHGSSAGREDALRSISTNVSAIARYYRGRAGNNG